MSKTVSSTTKNRKSFCWFKLLLICLAFFVLVKFGQQYQRYQHIQAEAADYRQKLEIAQSEYRGLQEQVKLLYRDSYLEQLARSSLGMVKAGEVLVSPAEIGDVPELNEQINIKDVFH